MQFLNRQGRVSAMTLALAVSTLAPSVALPQDPGNSPAPAPPRADGEGPWKRLILRGATLIDGTGAPPVGPVDIVVEGNRIRRSRASATRARRSTLTKRPDRRARGPCDRPLRPLRAARFRRPPRPPRRSRAGRACRVRAEALDGARNHHQLRSRQRQRARVHGRAQEEERGEPDHGPTTAALRLLRPGREGSDHDHRGCARFRSGCRAAGRRRHQVLRPAARPDGGRDRRVEEARSAHHVPPRPACRGPAQRAGHRAHGPHVDAALVRPARSALRRPHRSGLPARLQLQRRAGPLLRGRKALASGRSALQPALERGDGRAA